MTSSPLIRLTLEADTHAYIEVFLDNLSIAKRSEQTIRFYRGNLDRFDRWCRPALRPPWASGKQQFSTGAASGPGKVPAAPGGVGVATGHGGVRSHARGSARR